MHQAFGWTSYRHPPLRAFRQGMTTGVFLTIIQLRECPRLQRLSYKRTLRSRKAVIQAGEQARQVPVQSCSCLGCNPEAVEMQRQWRISRDQEEQGMYRMVLIVIKSC